MNDCEFQYIVDAEFTSKLLEELCSVVDDATSTMLRKAIPWQPEVSVELRRYSNQPSRGTQGVGIARFRPEPGPFFLVDADASLLERLESEERDAKSNPSLFRHYVRKEQKIALGPIHFDLQVGKRWAVLQLDCNFSCLWTAFEGSQELRKTLLSVARNVGPKSFSYRNLENVEELFPGTAGFRDDDPLTDQFLIVSSGARSCFDVDQYAQAFMTKLQEGGRG